MAGAKCRHDSTICGLPSLTALRGAVFDNVGSIVVAVGRSIWSQHCLRGLPRGERRGEGASMRCWSHRSRSPGPKGAPAGSASGRGRVEGPRESRYGIESRGAMTMAMRATTAAEPRMPVPPRRRFSIPPTLLFVLVSLWFHRVGGWICAYLRHLRFAVFDPFSSVSSVGSRGGWGILHLESCIRVGGGSVSPWFRLDALNPRSS